MFVVSFRYFGYEGGGITHIYGVFSNFIKAQEVMLEAFTNINSKKKSEFISEDYISWEEDGTSFSIDIDQYCLDEINNMDF